MNSEEVILSDDEITEALNKRLKEEERQEALEKKVEERLQERRDAQSKLEAKEATFTDGETGKKKKIKIKDETVCYNCGSNNLEEIEKDVQYHTNRGIVKRVLRCRECRKLLGELQ